MGVVSSTVAGTIGLIALAGAGATAASISSAKAAEEKKKQRTVQEKEASEERAMMDKFMASGEAPDAASAKEQARAAMEKQKRMRALAGGKTLLTSEGPTLNSGSGKTLLGA